MNYKLLVGSIFIILNDSQILKYNWIDPKNKILQLLIHNPQLTTNNS